MGIAHLRCGNCDDANGSILDITYGGIVMAEIIQMRPGQPVRSTLSDDALDLVGFIVQDIAELEDMFIRYPGMMSKHYEMLNKAADRLFVIMDAMQNYNGINKGE